MDGEPVEGEPSKQLSISEFLIQMYPVYMNMGMSYEEYWHGPPWLARAYRQAHEMRMRQEEWARHRQGAYIFEALLCAAPVLKPFVKEAKPGKYPEEPWPLTQKEADEQAARRERANYEKVLARRRKQVQMRKEEAEKQEVKGND